VSVNTEYSFYSSCNPRHQYLVEAERAYFRCRILCTKIHSRLSDGTLDTPCKQILLNGWIYVHGVLD